MSEAARERASGGFASRRFWLFLPLLGFMTLAGLFACRLGAGDPSLLPSALINKPVPDFSLPPIETGAAVPGLSSSDLSKGVTLVNVWASWCGPCRLEHPMLLQLATDTRFTLVGINYKDEAANAERFLGAFGDPFTRVGADRDGRVGIDWGVYGVPETFVVKDGIIVHKFVGPLSERALRNDLIPAVEKALGPS